MQTVTKRHIIVAHFKYHVKRRFAVSPESKLAAIGSVFHPAFLYVRQRIAVGNSLAVADKILEINLIGFIPADLWGKVGMAAPAAIGMAEFFSILFIAYEVVSILKNMTLAGLPVKKLWGLVKNFLGKYTEELPDDD